VERRVAGTVKSAEEAERRRRRSSMFSTGRMTSCRYLGADRQTELLYQYGARHSCAVLTRNKNGSILLVMGG